jgi:ferritin-like metal-binding protein YciE
MFNEGITRLNNKYMEELRQAYVKKLGKALDMEQCIVAKLPGMIEAATDDKLRTGLSDHLAETREHVARIEKILASNTSGEIAQRDDVFRLMIESAGKEVETIEDSQVRNAVIIASAQAVEHYEMARYGTLVEWAKTLDEQGDHINALKKTLDEEASSDKKLSTVAEGGIFSAGINQAAAHK